jgi:hypothetical protein
MRPFNKQIPPNSYYLTLTQPKVGSACSVPIIVFETRLEVLASQGPRRTITRSGDDPYMKER